jgi:hypothetical protein
MKTITCLAGLTLVAAPALVAAPTSLQAVPPLTRQQIRISPLTFPIPDFGYSLTCRNGSLHLSDVRKTYWTGVLGDTPVHFTWRMSDDMETLIQDESKQVIWTHRFPKPALHLEVRADRQATLTGSGGTTLWQGVAPQDDPAFGTGRLQQVAKAIGLKPGEELLSVSGLYVLGDTNHTVESVASYLRLIDASGKTVWSGRVGPDLPNVGMTIHVEPSPGQKTAMIGDSVFGVPTPPLPPGAAVRLIISRRQGSVTVSDSDNKSLGTFPVNLGHYDMTSEGIDGWQKQEYNQSIDITPRLNLTTTGVIDVVYADSQGNQVDRERVEGKLLSTTHFGKKTLINLNQRWVHLTPEGRETGGSESSSGMEDANLEPTVLGG